MNNEERKIFWNKLCSLDGTDLNADSATLRTTIIYPKYIYRFRAVNDNTIKALQSNTLYFSSPLQYDDPFDTYLTIKWEIIKEKIESINTSSQETYDKFIKGCELLGLPTEELSFEKFSIFSKEQILRFTIHNLVNYIRPHIQKNLFSLCFAEEPLNENLWLKYADAHKGFCLGFSLEDKSKLIDDNPLTLYPVYYSDEKYDGTKYAVNALAYYLTEMQNPYIAKLYAQENPLHWEPEKVSLIKHKCHEYDAEWRIISHNPDRSHIKWIPSRLYIGFRTSEADKKRIIGAANEAGIEQIYKVIISPTNDLAIEEMSTGEKEKYLQ